MNIHERGWRPILKTRVLDASNDLLTLITCHPRRGVEATDSAGVLPRFGGVVVHDRWKPYWHYQGCTHALCGAHLLRDLSSVAEVFSQEEWAEAMADLLREAKRSVAAAAKPAGSASPADGSRSCAVATAPWWPPGWPPTLRPTRGGSVTPWNGSPTTWPVPWASGKTRCSTSRMDFSVPSEICG